jgi:hypothetical protein
MLLIYAIYNNGYANPPSPTSNIPIVQVIGGVGQVCLLFISTNLD